MKSILLKNHWAEIWLTIRRFPLANASGLIAFSCFVFFNHHPESEVKPWLYSFAAVSLLGIPGFIASELFEEANRIRIRKRWYSKVIMLAYLIWQFYVLPTDMQESHILGLVIKFFILNLLVSISGYLNKRLVVYFWQFNKNLFFRVLQTALYGGVLFLGIAGAILAMEKLFLVHWPDTIYADTFFLIGLVFGTMFFTAGIPQSLDAPVFYPPGLKAFVQYVLVPLVLIYFLIIYGYGVKIILLAELPSGWVANLVLASGVASFLTFLLVWPISNHQENSWTRIFNKWIFKILIPLVFLMILALYQRVNQYGWTEDRFLVAIGSLFLLFNCLYFGFWKNKNLKLIPISLAIFLGFSVFGPWNIFKLSRQNQTERLLAILSRNQLLQNGKWIAAQRNDLPAEDIEEIQNQLIYLFQHFGFQPFEGGLLDSKFLSEWKNEKKNKNADFVYELMKEKKLDTEFQIKRLIEISGGSPHYIQFGQKGKGQMLSPELELLEFGQRHYLLIDSSETLQSELLNCDFKFSFIRNILLISGNGKNAEMNLKNLVQQIGNQDSTGELPEMIANFEQGKMIVQITALQWEQSGNARDVISVIGRAFILKK